MKKKEMVKVTAELRSATTREVVVILTKDELAEMNGLCDEERAMRLFEKAYNGKRWSRGGESFRTLHAPDEVSIKEEPVAA